MSKKKWSKMDPKCPRCGGHFLSVDRSGPDESWQATCLSCKKKFPYQSDRFQGEAMVCALCGKEGPQAPVGHTDWRFIQLEGRNYYVCTAHFPPDGSPSFVFRKAYNKVLSNLMSRQD